MALLLIVALSAGFFSGLKITKDAMVNTGDKFLKQQNFYDFRLFSTLGFTQEEVEHFTKLPEVKAAEGLKTVEQNICRIESQYRIRKLTPLECWRLMDFSDEDFQNGRQRVLHRGRTDDHGGRSPIRGRYGCP